MIQKTVLAAFCCLILNYSGGQSQFETQIDSILKTYDQTDTPGLSVKVIQQSDVLYSKGFGLSNLNYNIKNSDSTVFSLASIGKQFTAAAIWALINDNKIRLDDDVRTHIPEFPKYENSIKIKHLLNHTSGIRNYHTLMDLSGFDYNSTYYDNNTVLKLACKQKGLNNLPGEKVTYSNTNYNLLALIVERISGQNLYEYLKSKILQPLRMKETFVRVSHGHPIKNKAVGYQKRKDGFVFSTSNQLSYGAGSMGSTTNDMTIWMQMLNGQIPEFKALADFLKTTEVLTNGDDAKYARGIMLDTYKGYTTASHGGFGYGGRSQLITIPELQIGVIVLSNLQSINSPRIAYEILDIVLADKVKEIKEDTIEIFKPQDLNLFIGEYKEINSDMTMKVFVENDTLKSIGSIGRTAAALEQFSKNKFHRIHSQNVKYDFTPSAKHDMSISFGGTPFYFKRAKFVDLDEVVLSDFVGNFYSEELDVTYYLTLKNNRLLLFYKNNEAIVLHPIQLNEFGNGQRTIYHFLRDTKGIVNGMLLSCDGTVKDIVFKKKEAAN